MSSVEPRLDKIEATQEIMAKAIDKLVEQGERLIRVEERQIEMNRSVERIFTIVELQEKKIVKLESKIVPLEEVRGWFIKACMSFIGLVFLMLGYWLIGK